jgi:hypothetical protein
MPAAPLSLLRGRLVLLASVEQEQGGAIRSEQ